MRYQLGHLPGVRCPLARAAHKDFIVIHHNGLHCVLVDYCSCNTSYEAYQQLIDIVWFPATLLEPQTCATNIVMRQFHALNLQGKITAYNFYKSLVLLTDATGVLVPPVCFFLTSSFF
jgi:hypothetical protein